MERDGERVSFVPTEVFREGHNWWRGTLRCRRVEASRNGNVLIYPTFHGRDDDTSDWWLWADSKGRLGEDDDGLFVLENVKPGTYVIHELEAYGATRRRYYFPVDGDFTFTVPAETEGVLDLETVMAADRLVFRLTGRVVNRRGRPIANAAVDLHPQGFFTSGRQEVTTSREGVFTAELTAGFYLVHAEKRGFRKWFREPLQKSAVEFYLLPGAEPELELTRERWFAPGDLMLWVPLGMLAVVVVALRVGQHLELRRLRSQEAAGDN